MPLPASVAASVKFWPGNTTYSRSAPTACESEPKLVESLEMPVMVAVPGLAEVRGIIPEAGTFPPSVARTWTLLMVKVSSLLVPTTVMVTVRLELVTAMLALLMFARLVKVTLPTPALKLHPLGAVKINVTLVPAPKSPLPLPVLAMTMLPSVVNAGVTPFCATSADMLVPPVAVVTLTLASALAVESSARATVRAQVIAVLLIVLPDLPLPERKKHRHAYRFDE